MVEQGVENCAIVVMVEGGHLGAVTESCRPTKQITPLGIATSVGTTVSLSCGFVIPAAILAILQAQPSWNNGP